MYQGWVCGETKCEVITAEQERLYFLFIFGGINSDKAMCELFKMILNLDVYWKCSLLSRILRKSAFGNSVCGNSQVLLRSSWTVTTIKQIDLHDQFKTLQDLPSLVDRFKLYQSP